ncbi:hypothetical protein BABA_13392 [Neobacillus bataviensis LMG 21833]|uniref:Uncharacterized protein n=1 Tax=Neobacillus bataviensis LMG 21833 TaxID=1117379 RepID=K6E1K2_9BACI|nr:hypothetical protein [Neobacillus bataviensis]EKN67031.1 hypothetical protein BABA_13392 [Neobacillus bataviensis LMG 21833]
MKENKQALYFNMILGTIGTILIALSAVRYQTKEYNYIGYVMIFFGFALTISYINYLEKKSGISKKMTWIRFIVSFILFISFSYFLYF